MTHEIALLALKPALDKLKVESNEGQTTNLRTMPTL
jgi:hypothetical protein